MSGSIISPGCPMYCPLSVWLLSVNTIGWVGFTLPLSSSVHWLSAWVWAVSLSVRYCLSSGLSGSGSVHNKVVRPPTRSVWSNNWVSPIITNNWPTTIIPSGVLHNSCQYKGSLGHPSVRPTIILSTLGSIGSVSSSWVWVVRVGSGFQWVIGHHCPGWLGHNNVWVWVRARVTVIGSVSITMYWVILGHKGSFSSSIGLAFTPQLNSLSSSLGPSGSHHNSLSTLLGLGWVGLVQ